MHACSNAKWAMHASSPYSWRRTRAHEEAGQTIGSGCPTSSLDPCRSSCRQHGRITVIGNVVQCHLPHFGIKSDQFRFDSELKKKSFLKQFITSHMCTTFFVPICIGNFYDLSHIRPPRRCWFNLHWSRRVGWYGCWCCSVATPVSAYTPVCGRVSSAPPSRALAALVTNCQAN